MCIQTIRAFNSSRQAISDVCDDEEPENQRRVIIDILKMKIRQRKQEPKCKWSMARMNGTQGCQLLINRPDLEKGSAMRQQARGNWQLNSD